jgi:hypothetical protein
MPRDRLSIALADRERQDLAQLAARRQIPSARLAGELVAEGLDRVRRRTAAARVLTASTAPRDVLAGVDEDIHAALCTPGVIWGLTRPDEEVSTGALRALTYLADVSAWLDDPRAIEDRPRPPRLHDPVTSQLHVGGIAAALDRSGGADGRAVRSAEADGFCGASDKRQLSDMAPASGEEGRGEHL